MQAEDRKGLLRDITNFLAQKNINTLTVNTVNDRAAVQAHMQLTIEVSHTNQFDHLFKCLSQLPGVIEVCPLDPGK